ncbi:MAG: CZB domain-containing protein [Archangium sp.]|nr:CZB domain-containing protein [Archangium sp.]
MNTSAFVEAHVAWKLRLRKYLDGLPIDFDVQRAKDANTCELGAWLAQNPGHDELRRLHVAFHERAGAVVDRAKSAGPAAAKQLLNSEEFAAATSAVVKALMGFGEPSVAKQQPILDFNAVVVAHMEWRNRLKRWLSSGAADFDPALVGRSDACALGKWIASQPKNPKLAHVIAAHDQFHRVANDVVTAQQTDPQQALALLEGAGFKTASSEVVNALTRWKAA